MSTDFTLKESIIRLLNLRWIVALHIEIFDEISWKIWSLAFYSTVYILRIYARFYPSILQDSVERLNI